MTLTNYWWLLIWVLVGGGILSQMPKRQERLCGENVERWSIMSAVLMVLPYIVWAAFREGGADTGTYRGIFLGTSSDISDIPSLFTENAKDPGYTALTIIFKSVFGEKLDLFFFVIAAFQMLSIALVFRKYSSNFWVCIFLFISSTDYISWTWNGVRQFIAVVMIFSNFECLLQKKYVRLFLVIVLASYIHGSALLMIPIVILVQGKAWNKKTILMLLATVVVIVSIDRFTPILDNLLKETQYDGVMTNEIWTVDDGANIIRVLVYSVPAILSLLGLKIVRMEDDPVINICVNCSIVTMVLYLIASVTSGIYIGRLPIYTTLQGYIAMPWLIDHIFGEDSAKMVRMVMILLFSAFFYYQVFVTWG